jgi:large subunit ribosomal protein L5
MKEEFGYKNDMMIPRLEKIVLNIGAGEESVGIPRRQVGREDLTAIAGQKPSRPWPRSRSPASACARACRWRAKVTLRGDRMYDFLDRLITIAMPASATSAA